MIRFFKKFAGKIVGIFLVTHALCLNNIYAQNLLSDANINFAGETSGDLFTETIKIISRSGKIFILTNGNQLLSKGDFITLILKEDGPVSRAVVAKTHDGSAGIKILKVYSLARWKKLARGSDVQILKGDDSALFKPQTKPEDVTSADTTIDSEEDLFNDKTIDLSGELGDIYTDKRLIKPDNVVSAAYNQFRAKDYVSGDTNVGNQFYFSWAYQFSDNYWVEGIYGRTQFDNLPSGLQTVVNNFTVRAKYTFEAPLYSYLMPYIGFQTFYVSNSDEGTALDPVIKDQEAETLDALRSSNVALGFTVLKRMVPGWFIKGEIGNDIWGIGVAIEF